MARRSPRPTAPPKPSVEVAAEDVGVELAAWLGERLRRVALGLTAALLTARAYWPSEPDYKVDAGTGLGWVLAVLAVAGLAIAAALIAGTLRVRWSWTDAAVVALMVLVALSASHALDRRPAINLAWEWGALGIMYLLIRNLPRTPAESSALMGALAATAVAVSAYGIFQVAVELPELRAYYRAHPQTAMQLASIDPGAAEGLRNRLLGSNEPWSTFALTNSLAGFIVGPLVVMLAAGWEGVRQRDGRGARLVALLLAAPPTLVVLACLILTKSRSAYVGLAVGLLVLALRDRRKVSTRMLALSGLGGLVVVAALVAAGVATGRLDRQVITESSYSLRFRWQYWVGAWRVITESPGAFWTGTGPGNFADPYVRHKLPEASEEIKDPHNLVLEVWSTGGAGAALALVTALGLAFWNVLGPPSRRLEEIEGGEKALSSSTGRDAPPRRQGWLLACAGGGMGGGVAPPTARSVRRIRPLDDPGNRLALGGALRFAALATTGGLRRLGGRGGAGGRGQPAGGGGDRDSHRGARAVDADRARPEPARRSRVRPAPRGGRPAVGIRHRDALGRARRDLRGGDRALLADGVALAEGDAALAAPSPDFAAAEDAYERAQLADKYSARPWLAQARLDFQEWTVRGGKLDDRRWRKVPIAMLMAVEPPRNPNSWVLHRERANVMRDLLGRVGAGLSPIDLTRYRGNVVEALRKASLLYPTNALLHAQLADASAAIGMTDDAAHEAREALRLDALMPHRDRRLPTALREQLEKRLPDWEKSSGTARGAEK